MMLKRPSFFNNFLLQVISSYHWLAAAFWAISLGSLMLTSYTGNAASVGMLMSIRNTYLFFPFLLSVMGITKTRRYSLGLVIHFADNGLHSATRSLISLSSPL